METQVEKEFAVIQLMQSEETQMAKNIQSVGRDLSPKTTASFQIDLPSGWNCDRSCELLGLVDDQFESNFVFPPELFYELDGQGYYFLRLYPVDTEAKSVVEAYVHGFFEGVFHS